MPLQSSGAISLNDIQTEFGGTNPIDSNEYYRGGGLVPNTSVNINISTSGTISLSNFYGASKQISYIARLVASTTTRSYAVKVDTSGNTYITGTVLNINNPANECIIAKYNSNATLSWQRTLYNSDATKTEEGEAIAVDSSSNVYICGQRNGGVADSMDMLIAKYNTNGTIQWQRNFGGVTVDRGNGIAVDSSSNVYVCGASNSPGGQGNFDILIAKYDTNGTIQWQRSLGTNQVDEAFAIAVDSSGNVYICGMTNGAGAGSNDIMIAKYDTNGTIQWQRSLGGTVTDWGYGIAVDSSSNVFICGYTDSAGGQGLGDILIAKYDTNGTIQWQRSLGNANNNYAQAISVDPAGNVYICGYATSPTNWVIAKYNTSGTIQWQRSFSGNFGYSIAADSSDFYASGQHSTNGALTIRFPSDGSRTGTYSTYTYEAITFVDAARSLTSATRTLVSATRTLSSNTSTLTDAATSYTSEITSF